MEQNSLLSLVLNTYSFAEVFQSHPFGLCVHLGQSLNSAAWEGTGDWQYLFCSHLLLGCVGLTKCFVTDRSFLVQGHQPMDEGGWGEEKPAKVNLRQPPELLKAGSDTGIQPGRSPCRVGISWRWQLDKFGHF